MFMGKVMLETFIQVTWQDDQKVGWENAKGTPSP